MLSAPDDLLSLIDPMAKLTLVWRPAGFELDADPILYRIAICDKTLISICLKLDVLPTYPIRVLIPLIHPYSLL